MLDCLGEGKKRLCEQFIEIVEVREDSQRIQEKKSRSPEEITKIVWHQLVFHPLPIFQTRP
jgi:hypothetical protein